MHKIESIIAFIALHDEILIKKISSDKHQILFKGKFSTGIKTQNTVSKLLKNLEQKKILRNQKFKIIINKKIPNKAGLGGGSMNAANILKYFIKKKIITLNKEEIFKICKSIGSDVVLGLNFKHSILTQKNQIKKFKNIKKFYILIVKPNFGCSTGEIYSKVRKFTKPKLNRPSKKMFSENFLKKNFNFLEPIVISKYKILKTIKLYLENLSNPSFVRMTGSGSAFVAYYRSKENYE